MRTATLFAPTLFLIGSFAIAGDPWLPPPPEQWDAKYWDAMMKVAHNARDRGDRHNAERLCVMVYPYVDKSIQKELDNYANALTQANDEHAAEAHANAKRYAEILEMHATASEPMKTPLGFSPFDELIAYAELLKRQRREKDATKIRELALAQRQTQQGQFNRMQLIQQGKDPRGEC